MQNLKQSIRIIVSSLNNDESEGGGFWLPNIQRPFVWSEEQIARLFDSIMREYPINTLLVWKTRERVKHRKFIDNYHQGVRLTDYYVPDNTRSKRMVLDGQQRLQSLFIGLRGSYAGTQRELYFNVLSGEAGAPEDIRYHFAFMDKTKAVWPWMRFKDIVFITNKLDMQIAQSIEQKSPHKLTDEERYTLQINIARARQEFVNDQNITFQELDGIDNPDTYKIDDIVEIFIRANSGGTKLSKSDLLFSLLISSWEEADAMMEELLESLNMGGFDYNRDFVLKACLTILDKGAAYDVAKFRDASTKEQIVSQWQRIANAIKAVRDFVISKTYIRSDKALASYNALIPLIYFCYHYPQKFNHTLGLQEYLLRALISGVFSGRPDSLIDKIVNTIKQSGDFNLKEVYEVIRADGRSLEISPDAILRQQYGSRTIHLFFNLWYQAFNYEPALQMNGPQVDHIFPQSLLRTIKNEDPERGQINVMKYRAEERNQIANCMLLTAAENGPNGKGSKPPTEWFNPTRFGSVEAHEQYLKVHLIPTDQELWKIENFDRFIEARKALIIQKFEYMLRATGESS